MQPQDNVAYKVIVHYSQNINTFFIQEMEELSSWLMLNKLKFSAINELKTKHEHLHEALLHTKIH